MIFPGIVVRYLDAEPVFSLIIVIEAYQITSILVVKDDTFFIVQGTSGGVITMRNQYLGLKFDGGILIESEADREGDGVPDIRAVEVEVVLGVDGVCTAEGEEGQKGHYFGGFIHF